METSRLNIALMLACAILVGIVLTLGFNHFTDSRGGSPCGSARHALSEC